MRLGEYVADMGVGKFAEEANIPSRALLYDYISGKKTPSRKNMKKIFEATNGVVTPNDFYNFEIDEEEKMA